MKKARVDVKATVIGNFIPAICTAIGAALFLFGLVLIVTTGLPFNTSGMTQTLAEVKSVFASNFTGIGLLIACMAMLKLKVVKKTEE